MNSRGGQHRPVIAAGLLGDIQSLQAALGEEIKNLKLSQNLNLIAHKTLEKARQVLIKNASGYKELEVNYMKVKSENETLRHRIGRTRKQSKPFILISFVFVFHFRKAKENSAPSCPRRQCVLPVERNSIRGARVEFHFLE